MKNRKIIYLLTFIALFVISFLFYRSYKFEKYSTNDFEFKYKKSERLLVIDLPEKNNWLIAKPNSSKLDLTSSKFIYTNIINIKLIDKRYTYSQFIELVSNDKLGLKEVFKKNKEIEVKFSDNNKVEILGKDLINTFRYFFSDGYVYVFQSQMPRDSKLKELQFIDDIVESFKIKVENPNQKAIITSKKEISSQDALKDLDKLFITLQINPILLNDKTMDSWQNEYSLIAKKIAEKPFWRREELHYLWQGLIAKLNDGHSSMEPNQFIGEENQFPLNLYVRDKSIYFGVNKYYPELSGYEILSINNISSEAIYKNLNALISKDKDYIDFSEYKMGSYFSDYYALAYGFPDVYKVIFKTNTGEKKSVIFNKYSLKNSINSQDSLEFSIRKNNGISIKINNFKENAFETYQFQLEEVLNKLKKKEYTYVILDERGNMGGSLETVNSLFQFVQKLKKINNNIILISDRATYSGAFVFQALCKKENIKIVGEPLGGNLNMTANTLTFGLENSNFTYEISSAYMNFSKIIFNKDIAKKEDIFPDVIVKIDPRLEAIGVDQVMSRVNDLIQKDL